MKAVLFKSEKRFESFQKKIKAYDIDLTVLDFKEMKWIEFDYSDVDFEVPLGINGGAYDRYLVRIEEVRQSLKIISQLLDNLPTGTVMLDDSRFTMPDKEEVFTDSKELENHCRFFSDGIVPQKKEIYSFVESSAGELGFYIISDGGKRPYRVKLRSPGFPACQAWSQIAKGHKLEDVAIGFASFGVDFCELDR